MPNEQLRTSIMLDKDHNEWIKKAEYRRDDLINTLISIFRKGEIDLYDERDIMKHIKTYANESDISLDEVVLFMLDNNEMVAKVIVRLFEKYNKSSSDKDKER